MSVMECSRTGCTSILCDTYVDGIGYVCNGCQYSFRNRIDNKFHGVQQTSKVLLKELKKFMSGDGVIPKQKKKAITVEEFFKQY